MRQVRPADRNRLKILIGPLPKSSAAAQPRLEWNPWLKKRRKRK
jgi:hypothetical protein